MNEAAIKDALADISAEQDPTLKALKMASLCSTVFRERKVELVVVGGSAIELLTDGAYTSGDLDLCYTTPAALSLRLRQELMAPLNAEGGPRSWRVAGLFVDILGSLETCARTPRRKLAAPYGVVEILPPEELFVERLLIAVYPQPHPPALDVARKLAGLALQNKIEMDWQEVKRLSNLPDFRIWPDCKRVVNDLCEQLGIQSPYHSDE